MLFRQADVWETGVKMADVFYKILQMSISASWLILAIVVLRIFLKKVPRKIICFLWALVAIRLVCPFAIESRFSLIPDTQGIFADYENQLENAGTDNVNAGLPDMSGAVGGALDNEGAAVGNADMASGKLNNEIDNAAGNITAGNTAGGNITGGSVSDGGIAAGNIADKNNMSGNIPNISNGNAMAVDNPDRVNNGRLNDISGGNIAGSIDNADNNLSGAATYGDQKAAAGNVGYRAILAGKLGGINPGRFAFIWAAGCVVLLLYAVCSYILLKRKTGAAFNNGENIYICDDIDTPFILGTLSPKIYIPSLLTEEERSYVIAHEKAHLKRLDCVWKPLGFILLAVYWFNPLSWVAYILLCRDIELACDERVIADKDIEYKKQYAMTLLNCSSPKKMVSACPLAFGEVSVKTRIKTVLNYKKPAFWLVLAAVAACVVVMVCFMTNPKSSAPDNESAAGENIDESSSAEPDSEKLVAEGGSEVINNNGWSVWFEAMQDSSFSYSEDGIDIAYGEFGEKAYLRSLQMSSLSGTYGELRTSDKLQKWGMQYKGTLEEYIDGEVGVSIYKYDETASASESEEPGEGYFIIFGSTQSCTVWTLTLPVGATRTVADRFINAAHLTLEKNQYAYHIEYAGWNIAYEAHDGWTGSYDGNILSISNSEDSRSVSLVPYSEAGNRFLPDNGRQKESTELYTWKIENLRGSRDSYKEYNGNIVRSIYSIAGNNDDNGKNGYVVIYSAAESDIVWYIRFSEEYSENDVYDIIGGINISSADALAAWDGKLKYYDSKLSLTVYEQYERAQDRIDFLGKGVLDENGAVVRVFDLLTEELKSANTGLYEKLKDPVSSVQALLEFNYTSSVVYNYYSAFDGSRKVVEYTLDDGSRRAIEVDYSETDGLWMPAYEYDVDSSGYESIVLANKYMDGITADRLKQVTQIWTGVSEMGDTIFDVSDNYVILDSAADSDIVLYGMYGGETMVIRDGEHVIPVWTYWMSPHMVMPQIHYGDYDNDGVYEYAIWSNMDTGTGVSGDELYIIEADYAKENSEEDFYSIKEYSDWGGDLDNAVSYYLDDTGNVVTMTLNGEDVASVDLSGHFEEHKEYNESFDGIDFGSHYSFHEQDGIWYFVNAGRIYVKRDGKSVYDEDMIPYNVVVNARVVYEPDQQFHLEDIEIIVEERNN